MKVSSITSKPKWLNIKSYPFRPHYTEIDGQKMHFIDSQHGASTAVMVHGTPTWSFVYRHLIKALSDNVRCIAPDHIGFGLSDKPVDYPYSAEKHSENFGKFVDKLGVEKFDLIVHDFGGPIGLNYAVNNPHRINRIICMNTWSFSMEEDPSFNKVKKVLRNPFLPFLYKQFNFSAKYLLPKGYAKKKVLIPKVHAHYTAPFGLPKERMGTLGFAQSLLYEQEWFEEIWKKIEVISEKEILFLWGMKDPFLGEYYFKKMKGAFINADYYTFENSGHFVMEEEKEAINRKIWAFLSRE
ncbi:alpha/beta fold hydrolase [Flammeovirgaceae bacterium SG7u.111]|nr:alpha/beta fold hydrolase [Flammeovirgaceae bacterium SG7u.132]WPO34743.1 alpha/beta fold hydrolase [Flammeovirgaceae bacterium SG7u.111]